MRILVHRGAEELAASAARAVAEVITSGDVTVGLAGGSTPQACYVKLKDLPIPWDRVELWLSDERWVPLDHADSNGRKAAESLGQAGAARLHRPRWSEFLEPDDSAAFYEAELRDLFAGSPPDLVLLGMGTDGHTASLFPDTKALVHPSENRWFVANHVPQLDTWRLTVTPALLHRAKQVIVLVEGAAKAEIVADVIQGPEERYPIQLLSSIPGDVIWMIDEAAADGLTAYERV